MNRELITKYLAAETSHDEKMELLAWVEASEENKKAFAELKNAWALASLSTADNDLKSKPASFRSALQNKIPLQRPAIIRPERNLYREMLKIAAVVLFTVGLTAWIFFIYFNSLEKVSFNKLTVPVGQQAQLELSDGTKVWLNAGTTLTYPTDFDGTYRVVSIDGEGYFEVAHNKKKPFIVKTSDIQVKVLGTSFSLTSYANDEDVKLFLKEGAVNISTQATGKVLANVKPDQLATFSKKSKVLIVEEPQETDQYKTWWTGHFKFRKMPFEDLAKRLERKFNVGIRFESDDLKKILYTGSFYDHEPLTKILDIMKTNSNIKYEIKNNEVIIKKEN